MTKDEIIASLERMARCIKPNNCEQCPYMDENCIAMNSIESHSCRVPRVIFNTVRMLKADTSAPAAPAPAEADPVNHPAHYTHGKHECIEEMEILFGREAVISYCRLAAYKYKYRAGHKDDAELDYQKADWYLDKAAELMARNKQEVPNAHKQQEQGRKV